MLAGRDTHNLPVRKSGICSIRKSEARRHAGDVATCRLVEPDLFFEGERAGSGCATGESYGDSHDANRNSLDERHSAPRKTRRPIASAPLGTHAINNKLTIPAPISAGIAAQTLERQLEESGGAGFRNLPDRGVASGGGIQHAERVFDRRRERQIGSRAGRFRYRRTRSGISGSAFSCTLVSNLIWPT